MALPPAVTIPVAFVHGVISGVERHGLSSAALLTEAGIEPCLLQQVHARVTAEQYVKLFRLVMQRLGDETLGLLSRPLRAGSLALVARSALGAPTIGVASRRMARTFGLLQDDLVLQVVRDQALAGLVLRFARPAATVPVFLHELLLRVFWRLLAWLAGGQLQAERFDFAFEMPPYAGSYGKVFPAQLRFGQATSAFWFDAARLQDAVRRDEAALRAFLADAQTYVILPRRSDDVTSARVRRHLQETQPAWPDLEETASALHMSHSTLQRRLASEGTSFQFLKDELRRDIAITRLNTSMVPLATLADDLGFADSAAFQRAFKGWTGSTPGSYRRRD